MFADFRALRKYLEHFNLKAFTFLTLIYIFANWSDLIRKSYFITNFSLKMFKW